MNFLTCRRGRENVLGLSETLHRVIPQVGPEMTCYHRELLWTSDLLQH
jgi:hypothetical protein